MLGDGPSDFDIPVAVEYFDPFGKSVGRSIPRGWVLGIRNTSPGELSRGSQPASRWLRESAFARANPGAAVVAPMSDTRPRADRLVRSDIVSRYALFTLPIDIPVTLAPVDLVSLQLRAAFPTYEWDAQGVNRSIELATILVQRASVRNLLQLQLVQLLYEVKPFPWSQPRESLRFAIDNGGRRFGFLGEQDRAANDPWLQLPNHLVAWSAAGKGNVSYQLAATQTGFVFAPVWASSSDLVRVRPILRQIGMIALTIGLPLAGISAAGSLGTAILGSVGVTSPALASVVGNVALSTALNGGDIESAVKNAVISVATGGVGSAVAAATNVAALGSIAASATNALVQGGDVKKAVLYSAIGNVGSVVEIFDSTSNAPPSNPDYGNEGRNYPTPISTTVGPSAPSAIPPIWSVAPVSGPVMATAPFVPPPAPVSAPVPASIPVAAQPPLNIPNIINTVTSAALQVVRTVRAFRDANQPAIVTAARVTTTAGMTQVSDNGLILTSAGTSQIPPVGIPHSTISGNLIVNNGDGSYTVISPSGQTRVNRYGRAGGIETAPGSNPFNVDSNTLLIGGAAILAVLLLTQRSRNAR